MLGEVHQLLVDANAPLPPSLPYRNFIAQARSVPADEHEAYFRTQLADIDEQLVHFAEHQLQRVVVFDDVMALQREQPLRARGDTGRGHQRRPGQVHARVRRTGVCEQLRHRIARV